MSFACPVSVMPSSAATAFTKPLQLWVSPGQCLVQAAMMRERLAARAAPPTFWIPSARTDPAPTNSAPAMSASRRVRGSITALPCRHGFGHKAVSLSDLVGERLRSAAGTLLTGGPVCDVNGLGYIA